jgi:hypothetical protein
LVTVVSCDNANGNLYHQRLTEKTKPSYWNAIDVDNLVHVSSQKNSPAHSVIEEINIPSHETSHSSIAESLHSVVSML